jgi:hypothetical protein
MTIDAYSQLANVKRIVGAHGTHFALEGQSAWGTTVWFGLPVEFAPWS